MKLTNCETKNVFYLIVIHRTIFIEYLSKPVSGYNVYTLRFSIGEQSVAVMITVRMGSCLQYL